MNHKWNYQPPSQEQTEAAKALAKETGISPILCKLTWKGNSWTLHWSEQLTIDNFVRPLAGSLHFELSLVNCPLSIPEDKSCHSTSNQS